MKEIWRPLRIAGGMYEVSSFGRIASFHSGEKRILKQSLTNGGHLRVKLRERTYTVSHLVLEAFSDTEPSNRTCAKFRDGNRLNVRADNLYWNK